MDPTPRDVFHRHTGSSGSAGEKSGLVSTDDVPPSSGGGVSPALDTNCELTLERERRE